MVGASHVVAMFKGRRGAVVVTTLHSNHVAHGGGVGAYHVLNSGDINAWVGA